MHWKTSLGQQIQTARERSKISQEELARRITSDFAYKYSRAQISNVEKGKSAAAVNIVSAIAEILKAEFEVDGCKIGRRNEGDVGKLSVVAHQLSLPFDVEHSFSSASLKLTALPENSISLHAVFTRGQTKPLQIIEMAGPDKVPA
jgi:transcriptional regulator with XRE-family HTH domain